MKLFAWIGVALALCGPASAQSISYVASVKLNPTGEARAILEYSPGGRLTGTAVTVAQLLRTAYPVQPSQLVGAPAWISVKRYDIAAKAEDTPPPSQQEFVRTLLKDRFNLMVHDETRELPIFVLEHARSDGKAGPQLRKTDFDCAAYFAGPHDLPKLGDTPNCATNIGPAHLSAKSISMAQLARSLGPLVHRFTVDRTGLTGAFDVELTWTPDSPPDSSGPSIYTALQEQLGLKLVSEKGPVPVVVVDRLEEPSPN